ncbi:ABC transporter permease [Bradyrhizobium sp. UFLA06-06]
MSGLVDRPNRTDHRHAGPGSALVLGWAHPYPCVAVTLQWLPAFGADGVQHVVLPAIALGWYPVAAQTRIIRSGMLEVLDSDYIRMGRSVGTPERLLIWKYAFRNALLPLVTTMGVYFASMLSGAFVVETVFAWPGLGRTVVEAVPRCVRPS